jgi:hypothetical protein
MATRESLFDSILENSISTGIKTNLEDAITNAGVKIPKSTGLWEYPEIIRKNLVNKTVTGINILGGDVINIDVSSDENVVTYNLSTVFDSNGVVRPNYAHDNKKWGKELTVEAVFNDLFSNILPAVRGVHAGDMTVTNINGDDTQEWNNTLFKQTGLKTGLEPTSRYIRLYLTCQAEPIYIHIGNLVKEVTNGYNVKSSDTVEMRVDDLNNSITAHINTINDKQLEELGIIDTVIDTEQNIETN